MTRSKYKGAAMFLAMAHCISAIGYNAVVLHGPGVPFSISYGWGIEGGQQVGHSNIFLTGGSHALLWSGSPQSLVNLHPAGFHNSFAMGADGGRQIGYAEMENPFRQNAILWSGSAQSYVNLHPAGFWHSAGLGIGGGVQVGGGTLQPEPHGSPRALLWRGTAESVVDLHPSGITGASTAYDTDGVQQVGAVGMGGPFHAALWEGTRESFINLNPPGADSSWAYSVANGEQAGYAGFSGQPRISAVVWHGSAQSFVSLNPGAGWGSKLFATNGIQQAGLAAAPGPSPIHAAVWSGTANSMIDLHAFLPPQFRGAGEHSEAMGIDEFGNVVGWAIDLGTNGGARAVMWVVPEPATVVALSLWLCALAARRRKAKASRSNFD